MRFVAIYRTVERNTPPTTEEMAAMGKFIDEVTEAGVLLDTGGCLPSAMGARVRREGGKMTVTDGPFAESKEVIAGYAILQTATKEEAIEWTKRFLDVAGDGESEIRPLFDAGDCVGELTPELREAEARRQARMAANA
jgi:hypothetical protein